MYKQIIETINRGNLNIDTTPVYPFLLIPEGKEDDERNRNNYMLFHFSMWLTTNNVYNFKALLDFELTAYPVVDTHRSKPVWIMFGSKKDRSDFARWLKKYRTRFIGNSQLETSYVPKIPIEGRHTLSYVEISFFGFDPAFGNSYSDNSFEIWSWIINNCEKKVWCADRFTAFSSDKDAMLFKLRWG